MKLSTRHLVVGLGFAALASPANGAALIYEPFGMDATANINGSAGGTGLSTWTSNGADVTTGTLNYGSLATEGNKLEVSGNYAYATTSAVTAQLDDADTLWFSVILRTGTDVGTNPDIGFAFGTSFITGSNNLPMSDQGGTDTVRDGFGFTVKQGQARATYWNGGALTRSGTNSGNSVTAETAYLLVGEMIWGAGATDQMNLYFADEDLNLSSVISSLSGLDFAQAGFDTVSLAAKGAGGPHTFDEVRFGATSDDVLVVPEPSAALLGGLGALLLLRRRR